MKLIKRGFLAACIMAVSLPAIAMDTDGFRTLASNTVKQMEMGVVGDVDELIAMQEQLMVIGMQGGVEYLRNNPNVKGRPLQITILSAEKMKKMTLDQIEAQWHEGKYLAAKGVDKDSIDHFGPMMSLMDTVIHPATSYLALKEYKKTGNPDLLQRVKAELVEVLVHLDHITPEAIAGQVQVASDH